MWTHINENCCYYMLLILSMLLLEFLSIIAIIAIFIIITINGLDGTLCAAVVERVGRRKCSQGDAEVNRGPGIHA